MFLWSLSIYGLGIGIVMEWHVIVLPPKMKSLHRAHWNLVFRFVTSRSIQHTAKPLPKHLQHHWHQGASGIHDARRHFGALHATAAQNGIFDSVRSKMTNLRKGNDESRELKAFQAQMKYLSDASRPIEANVYLETIEDLKGASGLSGFREHLPWVSNSPILSDMKREQEVLKSLTEFERRNPGRVPISAKKRVARAVGVDLPEIESLLDRVVGMRDVQRWIVKRKSQDLHVPTSSTELQQMLSTPGSGFNRSRTFKRKIFPNPGCKPNRTGKRW